LQSKAEKVYINFDRFVKVNLAIKIISHQAFNIQFSMSKISRTKTKIQDFEPNINL